MGEKKKDEEIELEKMSEDDIRKVVRQGYAQVATKNTGCCGPSAPLSCCSGEPAEPVDKASEVSKKIGYSDEELDSLPDGANMGLGCGNPVALASLKKGDVVMDLGSGAGVDCFLAAQRVGDEGKVIGVDMTHEMLAKARANARKAGLDNVEFRLGEIENLPVADNSVDVVISNCVINLSPNKERVFSEAYRTLRPGGRVMVSDIVLKKDLPEALLRSASAYIGCVAGAIKKEDYLDIIRKVGFEDIKVVGETEFPVELMLDDPQAQVIVKSSEMSIDEMNQLGTSVVSLKVSATKPTR